MRRLYPLLILLCLSPAAAQLPDWNFTTKQDFGWTANDAMKPVTTSTEGLTAGLHRTDPWMVGPAIHVDASQARYVFIRMKIAHHGGGGVYFATETSPQFKQENMVRFRVAPGGDWQDLLVDMATCPGWKGTITRLRLDPIDVWPNIPAGQPIVIARIALRPADAKPADVQIASFHAGATWLVPPGRSIEVRAQLRNDGGQPAKLGPISLNVPPGCGITSSPKLPTMIGPRQKTELVWNIAANHVCGGAVSLTVPVTGGATLYASRRLFVHAPEWSRSGAELLQQPAARITAVKTAEWQYGTFVLEAKPTQQQNWTLLGIVPSLGTVSTTDKSGALDVIEFLHAEAPHAVTVDGGRGWQFTSRCADRAGRMWFAELTVAPCAGQPLFAVRLKVHCSAAAEILRLDGPTIIVPPFSVEAMQGGIFGGLVWTQGAEPAWDGNADRSELRIRYRPHVNRIAEPLMALARAGGWTGWLWQPGDSPPGAVFGAPTEEVTGRQDSVMGLFRPAITDTAGENGDFGMKPMRLEPTASLAIAGDLLLGPADKDLSRLCRLWIDRFGLPAPSPSPRGDDRNELAFTVKAFLNCLWDPATKAWFNGLGPSKATGRFGPFLTTTLLGARLLEGATADACRQRLAETERAPSGYRGDELPWSEGSLLSSYRRQAGGLLRALQRQHADGGWTFRDWIAERRVGNEKHLAELGDLNRSEVGFGAATAANLLDFARVTGDRRAREAGLKALEWIDRFVIPRAAQCWEVPVQAPDIVAAADAVRAFVQAYYLTGNRDYLTRAEVWADRGLPFVYFWNDKSLPQMRYASVAVLGASWYTGSWYGRPVQWCGLNYAEALGQLIDAGVPTPWTQIRDGLLGSGMQQQFTEPNRSGLIPDSIDLTAGGLAADYWVAPYMLAEGIAQRLRMPDTPRTALAGSYRVSAMGEVAANTENGRLTAALTFHEPGPHHILIAGIGNADAVTIDGQTATRDDNLSDAEGWSADFAHGFLEICIGDRRTAHVNVSGVTPKTVALLPPQ